MPAKLGQHFLKNNSAIKKIIACLDIQPGETIIEIGPGKGALTLPMAKNDQLPMTNFQIIAIEKDAELVIELNKKIQDLDLKNIKIIEGDALQVLPKLIDDLKLENRKWKIVGNIPYYITGKLLRTISELKNKPTISVLMVQKEVAERISGKPPHNNLLASAMAIWANTKIILNLKASEFDPPPEVDSAVIKLTTNTEQGLTQKELEKYYKLIHIIFKQPRKTLANNLKDGLKISRMEIEKILHSIDLPLNSRPQDISIEQVLKISKLTTL